MLYKWTINKLQSVSTRDLSAKANAKLNLTNKEIASFVLNLTAKIMVNYITPLFKHDGWIIPRLIRTSGAVKSTKALQGDSWYIVQDLCKPSFFPWIILKYFSGSLLGIFCVRQYSFPSLFSQYGICSINSRTYSVYRNYNCSIEVCESITS